MSPQNELQKGVRDILPMLLGTMPFAIIYGGLAAGVGFDIGQTLGMSALVYAGSSQFIVISMLGTGSTLVLLWLTTLLVNLRHALYSASLQPFVRQLSPRWRLLLAFLLADETFAVVQQRYAQADASPYKHWYFLGAGLAMYLNWSVCTLLGVLFAQVLPSIAGWGLDFAMLATFIGVVVPMLRNCPQVASALLASVVALICHPLPYQLGLLAAVIAGILAGLALQRRVATAPQESLQ